MNFDDHDDADEETQAYLQKEIDAAETGTEDHGKPGSLLNRMILHGNKKTEDEIASGHAGINAQQRT